MNIFHTDNSAVKSALALDDLRLNKMIIESAALLANAIAFHGGQDKDLPLSKTSGMPFKTKAWQNHPSCLWVKESSGNYTWLLVHLSTMIAELEYRKGTKHSMGENLRILEKGLIFIPDGALTTFANCTPYKQITDPIKAYRLTMAYKWEHDAKVPVWTKRDKPEWFTDDLIAEAKSIVGEFPWTGERLSRSKRTKGWLTNSI